VQDWGKDPRQIVIDEYATFLIPLYFTPKRLVPLIMTFILFRLFDIIKPPPLRRLEKVNAGWGIMLYDLGASVYTTIIIIIVFILFKL
jgi:phosphatidylglycerophosphatase A